MKKVKARLWRLLDDVWTAWAWDIGRWLKVELVISVLCLGKGLPIPGGHQRDQQYRNNTKELGQASTNTKIKIDTPTHKLQRKDIIDHEKDTLICPRIRILSCQSFHGAKTAGVRTGRNKPWFGLGYGLAFCNDKAGLMDMKIGVTICACCERMAVMVESY